jgi:hypothetical protein
MTPGSAVALPLSAAATAAASSVVFGIFFMEIQGWLIKQWGNALHLPDAAVMIRIERFTNFSLAKSAAIGKKAALQTCRIRGTTLHKE